jgi:hypothetical protein
VAAGSIARAWSEPRWARASSAWHAAHRAAPTNESDAGGPRGPPRGDSPPPCSQAVPIASPSRAASASHAARGTPRASGIVLDPGIGAIIARACPGRQSRNTPRHAELPPEPQTGRDGRWTRPGRAADYFEPRLRVSDAITWSTVKLAAFCGGG